MALCFLLNDIKLCDLPLNALHRLTPIFLVLSCPSHTLLLRHTGNALLFESTLYFPISAHHVHSSVSLKRPYPFLSSFTAPLRCFSMTQPQLCPARSPAASGCRAHVVFSCVISYSLPGICFCSRFYLFVLMHL